MTTQVMDVTSLREIKMRYTADKIAKKKSKKKPVDPNTVVQVIKTGDAYHEMLEMRQELRELITIFTKQADAINEAFKSEMLANGINEMEFDGKTVVSITDFTQRQTALDQFKANFPEIYALIVTETPTKKINFSKLP